MLELGDNRQDDKGGAKYHLPNNQGDKRGFWHLERHKNECERDCRYHFRVDDGDLVDARQCRADALLRIEDADCAYGCQKSGEACNHQSKANGLEYDLQGLVFGIEEVLVVIPAEIPPACNRFRFVEAVNRKQDNRGVDKQENEPDKTPF